jgi:hypothetical protein
MGSLGELPGGQMKPKLEPKGSQKGSKNDVFFGFSKENGKCDGNLSFATL